MLLDWAPLVHLTSFDYEAWVSPSAGGRLCRLLWHGPNGDRELVVPVDSQPPFDEDHWPKQGAFPMLPFANRLKDGSFHWGGGQRMVRTVPGQGFGLHGFGHRRAWKTTEASSTSALMELKHQADGTEWPWAFSARLEYSLSSRGLAVCLSVCNESSTSMPAVLGWHPYVPAWWMAGAHAGGMASAVHALDGDGACVADATATAAATRPKTFVAAPKTPHTMAVQDWGSSWSIQMLAGERWSLTADAPHLVHHAPDDLSYVCVEPVTALPGRLRLTTSADGAAGLDVPPGAMCQLKCGLQATA